MADEAQIRLADTDGNATEPHTWWQRGVIYQVYPRSFQDSNGDGVGDLRGITNRFDYLTWLGVDAVWISPISPSPMADFGYDISYYKDVHPMFGMLEDFDALDSSAVASTVILQTALASSSFE